VPADYELEVDELRAIAARDATAFTRWFARCEIPLKQSLRSFAELVDVESVAQDAAFKVWENADHITPDRRPGFLLRWTKTVALNDARNKVRRSGQRIEHREALPADDSFVPPVRPLMRDTFFLDRVRRCLDKLNPHQLRAFRARLDDGGVRPDRELAASIGVGFDAFRQNLTRGRKALVECLGASGIAVREYLR
jgi:DNA-directed RNA polymerase specialized sigma24 family protein